MPSEEILIAAIKAQVQRKLTIEASIEVMRKELARVRAISSAQLDQQEKQKLLSNQPLFTPYKLDGRDNPALRSTSPRLSETDNRYFFIP